MKKHLFSVGLSLLLFTPQVTTAAEPEACQTVRLVELGWTDLALTNATTSLVLEALGYKPQQIYLSLNLAYESLKSQRVDVFLGNWLPAQSIEFKPYFDNNDVEVLSTNLTGGKFTLAVPSYVAEAGVHSFADLAKHADKFGSSIYGIEPGANKPLLEMIEEGRHGLGDWKVIESSEAAMLAQVERVSRNKDWIVFLGWEPHPMNIKFDLTYLSGGDVEYGPNYGGATVRTITRVGYGQECPNVAKLLDNLKFNLEYENAGMKAIDDDGANPVDVARDLIRQQPELLKSWLEGVVTIENENAYDAAAKAILAQ